jgi:histidine triad (HIT) family protein
MASLFSKIVSGEIPAHKVYEDDLTLAFLDIHPKTEGHVLVIPKVEVDEFQDLSDDDYQAVMATVKKVAKRLKQIYPDKRVGMNIFGLDVPHAHVHVFPFANAAEYKIGQKMDVEPDHEKLASVAKKLAFS